MKILVTGGAGFLGANLCEKLLSQGHEVICLDNFQTGRPEALAAIIDHPHLTVVKADVCDSFDFDVDQIYNLACPASPPHYQADPIKTFKTSVLGAINVLELAKRRGIRVLQASTSEVYGDPLVHPQTEAYWGNVNPIGPRACYDEGKRGAETLFFDYHRQHGVEIKVVRIFNTYGPLMDPRDGRVVSNFIVQALKGEPLTLYGNGEQTRSFCFVDDLINGLIAMMESGPNVTGPVNLGNPNEFSMLELARDVLALTGSASKLSFLPLPVDDPKLRRPDISAAKALLGWKPVIELHEGLERSIDYFKVAAQMTAPQNEDAA